MRPAVLDCPVGPGNDEGNDMNTPAHTLMAAALLARPGARRRNIALVAGSLIPDATILWFILWERFVRGEEMRVIFDERYFDPAWKTVFAIPNSIPLFALGAAAGYALGWPVFWAFCAAALAHVILDLPLHHDDGHPHFWPFSDWIYASPVSYWDPNHHGVAAGAVEVVLCIVLAVILWRRFEGRLARTLIALCLSIELLVPLGWVLALA